MKHVTFGRVMLAMLATLSVPVPAQAQKHELVYARDGSGVFGYNLLGSIEVQIFDSYDTKIYPLSQKTQTPMAIMIACQRADMADAVFFFLTPSPIPMTASRPNTRGITVAATGDVDAPISSPNTWPTHWHARTNTKTNTKNVTHRKTGHALRRQFSIMGFLNGRTAGFQVFLFLEPFRGLRRSSKGGRQFSAIATAQASNRQHKQKTGITPLTHVAPPGLDGICREVYLFTYRHVNPVLQARGTTGAVPGRTAFSLRLQELHLRAAGVKAKTVRPTGLTT